MKTRRRDRRSRRQGAVAITLLVALAVICQVLVSCGGGMSTGGATATHRAGANATVAVGDYDGDDFHPARGADADKDDEPKPWDRDGDTDNRSDSYYDGDDQAVRGFGAAATTADRGAVESLVRRYFSAAAYAQGSEACPLIASPLRRSVVLTLGHHPPGPAYASGNSCSEVMSKVFRQNHRQLAAEAGALDLIEVRVSGNRGRAVLGFAGLPGRQLPIVRETDVWKIQALLDEELP